MIFSGGEQECFAVFPGVDYPYSNHFWDTYSVVPPASVLPSSARGGWEIRIQCPLQPSHDGVVTGTPTIYPSPGFEDMEYKLRDAQLLEEWPRFPPFLYVPCG